MKKKFAMRILSAVLAANMAFFGVCDYSAFAINGISQEDIVTLADEAEEVIPDESEADKETDTEIDKDEVLLPEKTETVSDNKTDKVIRDDADDEDLAEADSDELGATTNDTTLKFENNQWFFDDNGNGKLDTNELYASYDSNTLIFESYANCNYVSSNLFDRAPSLRTEVQKIKWARDGKPCYIASISERAFQDCTALTELDFSSCKYTDNNGKKSGLTTIYSYAFVGCINLEKITFGETVTYIKDHAFLGQKSTNANECNEKLSEIKIPASVKEIGSYAFAHNKNLQTIDLTKASNFLNTSAIPDCIFLGCVLNSIKLSEDTESIPDGLFQHAGFKTGLTLKIPAGITKIGNNTFASATGLSSVTFEDGSKLGAIGSRAFAASSITSFDFDKALNLQIIGAEAFIGTPLVTIDLSNNNKLTELQNKSFYQCTQATEVDVPSTVKTVGDSVFAECIALSKITTDFPTIGSSMFKACTGLKTINFSTANEIGANAFNGCTSLTGITIPSSVTTIKTGAFAYCPSLKTVKIEGTSITEIPDSCFICASQNGKAFTSLESINIPSSVERIGNNAFNQCDALKSIELPDKLVTIGNGAFASNGGLTSITIPKNVENIGSAAFNALALQTIIIKSNKLKSIGSSPFGTVNLVSTLEFQEMEKIPAYFLHNTKFVDGFEIKISKDVKEIGDFAFGADSNQNGGTNYEKITFEEGSQLEVIGKNAFAYNPVIKEINLPSSVKVIGDNAFNSCTSLKGCTIPENVTNLGYNAFANCSSIGEIHYNAIEAVIGNGSGSMSETQGVFYKSIVHAAYIGPKVKSLPAGLLIGAVFQEEDSEDAVYISLVLPPTIENIPDFALTQIKNVDKLIISSDAVERIGTKAFYGCTNLEKIIINDTVKFDEASGLYTRDESKDEVRFPKNLKKIGSSAFEGCSKLACLEIPAGVESIGALAFADCVLFDKITLPENMTQIEDSTFKGCTGLTEVTFAGNNIFLISNGAFEGTGITGILDIPGGVKTINARAFADCDYLTEVDFPTTVLTIAPTAFANSSVSKFYAAKNTYAYDWITTYYPGMLVEKNDIIYNNIEKTDINNNDASYRTDEDMKFVAPSREGYTFLGWFKDEALTVPIESTKNCNDNPLNVYASWKVSVFNVNYNLNGGMNNPDNPSTVNYGQPLKLSEPRKVGSAFGGWFLDPEFKNPFRDIAVVKEDVTVYAKWIQFNYSIAFDPNGGKIKNGVNARISCAGDQTVTLFGEGCVSNGKKALVGWNTQSDGLGTHYEPGEGVMGLGTKANETVTLYAEWVEASEAYTIQYVLNSKTTVSDNILASGNKARAAVGRDKKILEAVYVNYPGYELVGWSTKKNGKGEKFEPGQVVKDIAEAGKTIKLYPIYIMPTYTITYNYMDDEIDKATQPTNMKTSYTAKKSAKFKKPKRGGYSFAGWYLNISYDEKTQKYTYSKKVTSTKKLGGNIVLYAKWKENTYSVTYDKNGAAVTSEGKVALKGKKNIKYNDDYTVLEVTDKIMTRDGYTFAGWNTKKDGSGDNYASGQVVQRLIKKNKKKVKLYAQWK